jgi:hypothetical protein
MALTSFDGSITTSGAEQDLFNITALRHFATWVYLDNLVGGDSVQIRVYIQDPNDSATMKKYIDVLISDAQSTPSFYIPWVPTNQYRVTIQRISGTDKSITWCRKEQ